MTVAEFSVLLFVFKEEKPVEKQPEAVTEEKAEPEHLTNICDLKAELEAKREEGFSESADSDEADDGEAPHGELFRNSGIMPFICAVY